jgi:hypothetical protein
MSYALFLNEDIISKSFSTKAEAWDFAEKSGLVMVFPSSDEDLPRRVLDFRCSIRLLASDHPEASSRKNLTS